jgi:hypothetical protein
MTLTQLICHGPLQRRVLPQFNRTCPRKDRSSGTLRNDPLFGRNRVFFVCIIHVQSPCDLAHVTSHVT